MNEWMCLSPRLFTVMHLQFIFINIGCIKATQGTNNNRNIERRSNVQRSMSTSSSIAFRKREKGRRVKIHKIIWMNEHTHLNPSVCLCVLVGRPYVGIFYRWHHFFVHENGINEGKEQSDKRKTKNNKSAKCIHYKLLLQASSMRIFFPPRRCFHIVRCSFEPWTGKRNMEQKRKPKIGSMQSIPNVIIHSLAQPKTDSCLLFGWAGKWIFYIQFWSTPTFALTAPNNFSVRIWNLIFRK